MKKFTFNLLMLILIAAFPLLFIAGIQHPGNKPGNKPLPPKYESDVKALNQLPGAGSLDLAIDWNPLLPAPFFAKN
jgi:hypothetical protein